MNTRILLATLLVVLCLSSCSRRDLPSKELTLDLGDKITMKLVLIPAGKFLMGSRLSAAKLARRYGGEEGYYANEYPQHEVAISQSFYMGIREVTQAQWRAIMDSEPWKARWYCKKAEADTPVCCIDWDDANKFCELLSKKTGRTVALPTEAQWEYACRAGTRTEHYFGDGTSELGDYAWFDENASSKGEDYPHAVGQKKPNTWGLYDMHGNVYEWCRDWYDEKFYAKAKDVDPENTTEARYRVIRGGSWLSLPRSCRTASRDGGDNWGGDNRYRGRFRLRGGFHSGFRVVVLDGSGAD